MPFPQKALIASFALCCAACVSHPTPARVSVAPHAATETVWRSPSARARDVRKLNEQRWYDYWAAVHQWEAYWTFVLASQPPITPVMFCIYRAESGDYGEHSHPGSGSGAAQFVPRTWRHWSAAAGHPGYGYAYEAPPAVQDAVLAYTLIHGGAGNWSPRFGADSCTVGMGG